MATAYISGKLTMDALAASLTAQEQLNFQQVTGLKTDSPSLLRNLVVTVDQQNQLGAIKIGPTGVKIAGVKLFSTTAFVSGKTTSIDVYRLPLI